jgi:hypothetical protein
MWIQIWIWTTIQRGRSDPDEPVVNAGILCFIMGYAVLMHDIHADLLIGQQAQRFHSLNGAAIYK